MYRRLEVVVSNISYFITKKKNISSSIFKFRDHIAATLWKDAQVSGKQLQLVFDMHTKLRGIHLYYCNFIVTLSPAAEKINK